MNQGIKQVSLGLFIFLGLSSLGYQLGNAAIKVKDYERSVRAKGLAEQEVPADIVIWPIQFSVANNDLGELYNMIEENIKKINSFITSAGIASTDITVSAPAITDTSAELYGNNTAKFRYTATQNVTVYSKQVDTVNSLMSQLSMLGKQGIVLKDTKYQIEYLFTGLNQLKPKMIEEATANARIVADKFAKDSQSQLGKIKRASQGQFSVMARDNNNPHIKNVRVVSTVEYYLAD